MKKYEKSSFSHLILTKKYRKNNLGNSLSNPNQTENQWVYSNSPINIMGEHFTSPKPKYYLI